jgi:hypothetical protein
MAISNPRPLPVDLFTDEHLIELPLLVKWTAVGLRQYADDQGREQVNSRLLKAAIWPLHEEVTPQVIDDHLLLLDEIGYIGIYASSGRNLYSMASWVVVSHPKPSRFPAPPPDLFRNASGSFPESFSAGEREGERERASEGEWAPEGAPSGSQLEVPPSPFCKLHRPSGTTSNCRHCGTARLANEQWQELRRVRDAEQQGDV